MTTVVTNLPPCFEEAAYYAGRCQIAYVVHGDGWRERDKKPTEFMVHGKYFSGRNRLKNVSILDTDMQLLLPVLFL